MCSAYPSPGRSLKLGRQNLHLFRLKNTRFDVIGGLVYFFLVVRCSGRLLTLAPVLLLWLQFWLKSNACSASCALTSLAACIYLVSVAHAAHST